MVRDIVKDMIFLKQKSAVATRADEGIARDLMDTLAANKDHCVGMAANMIGQKKNIIIVNIGFMNLIMYNPVIVDKKDPYMTEEGCLSLIGVRPAKRYKEITVEYQDINWNKCKQNFTGWTAQIIQHECDHLEGIII